VLVVSIERIRPKFATGLTCLAGVGAAAVAIIAALTWTAQADGAGYHVYSCRTPSSTEAPVEGWSPSAAGADVYTGDSCSRPGGALVAGLGDKETHESNVDVASWVFEAPAGEKIEKATLWRAGDADGGYGGAWSYEFRLAELPGNAIFGECVYEAYCTNGVGNTSQPLSDENLVVAPEVSLDSVLSVDASCTGSPKYICTEGKPDPNGYVAVVYLYAADIVLEQSVGPSVSDVSGELASGGTVAGTSDVTFAASDPGSGIYQAVFTVDGQVVQRTTVDENGGHCVDVGGTDDGLPAFLYTRPCKARVSGDVGFDSTRVSNGGHHLVVTVTDAAGNSAVVMDRDVNVSNPLPPGTPGPLNGRNASSKAFLTAGWLGSKKARLTRSYGRPSTISGRLTAPGSVGIGGAQIDCSGTPAYTGAKAVGMVCPKTGPDGRFTIRIPAGVGSRTVHLAYREHIGDAKPVATVALELAVRAGVRLSVSPHTTSVGHRIFFTGGLLGGPVPQGGKQLVLEARSPGGRWIEFDVVRTDTKGRFRSSYRFRFPGPASYGFRAVSEPEADFPFAIGASATVGVYER
jgi:hypothetical protein